MKYLHIKSLVLAVIITFTACSKSDFTGSDIPSNGDKIRLSLSSADEPTRAVWSDAEGSGSLSFEWENVEIDSEAVENLKFVLSDGQNPISAWNSALSTPDQESLPYSGLSVTPREGNANIASFRTSRFYSQADLTNAKYCFALSGSSELVDTDGKTGFHIQLPSRFTQTDDQDPSFLRENMYMYAESEFSGDGTMLEFNHIPATLRIIITNSGNSEVFLQSVSCSVADAVSSTISSVSSASADVYFDCKNGRSVITYDERGLDKITTILDGDHTVLSPGEKYTAYSMLLPLKNADSFKGKHLNINVKASHSERLALSIDAEKIAQANGGGIYNWVGGKSYTLRIDLGSYPDPLYTFGLLSDVHCQSDNWSESMADFKRALTFFNEKNVLMTCISGDISQDGTAEDFALYADAVRTCSPTIPVYTTSGNHDCTESGKIDEALWEEYTGHPLVYEQSVKSADGKVDHYLFLGMSYWNFTIPYLDTHMSWLEEKLETYRNERCFVITHLFFPDRAGNLNGIYPVSNWLTGVQLERLEKMCDNYLNSIWISGHSHWKWAMQKYQDRANIYRTYDASGTPASGWCLHVPSCSYPIDSDGVSTRDGRPYESEGALVQVYDDHINILALDLKQGKYIPIGCYKLDTELYEVPESENAAANLYLSASDFNFYKGVKDNLNVKDVEGMPGYVEITFTGVSQGYYVKNSTFVPDESSKVSIIVEDLQVTSGGKVIDTPAKVGFYGGSYYLQTTNSAYVNNESGVQFQTSSSCAGPWPFTIRMKASMQFY